MKILFGAMAIGLFGLLSFAPPADAAKCSVNATALNFGSYDIFSPIPRDATSIITVDCKGVPKNPIPVTISLSPGTSGSFVPRRLQGPVDQLVYNLFTDTSHATIWGDGNSSSQPLTNAISSSTPWNATLYGRIPARQNISAGNYSDSIVVTIDW